MAISFSDNQLQAHPKPSQEYERQQGSGQTWADWPDFTTLTTTLNALGYTSAFRRNKYFWVAGAYYRCNDDGTTFTQVNSVAAASVVAFKFLCHTSGTPPANIDAYVPVGNTLTWPALSTATRIVFALVSGVGVFDFGGSPSFTFGSDTLDFTAMGGAGIRQSNNCDSSILKIINKLFF